MGRKQRTKMTKDIVPEGFTLGLALVDALPVLFFCLSGLVVGVRFGSIWFLTGAMLCLFSGMVKVLWKVVVVLRRRNIWWMFLQMRILMPVGFLLMLLSLAVDHAKISMAAVWHCVSTFPAAGCFLVGLLGMVAMMVFAARLDSSDPKSNWIEQITNGIAQLAILLGVLLAV